MLETLDLVNQVTEEYPPETGHESRFGNPAFRKFYDQIGLVRGRRQRTREKSDENERERALQWEENNHISYKYKNAALTIEKKSINNTFSLSRCSNLFLHSLLQVGWRNSRCLRRLSQK